MARFLFFVFLIANVAFATHIYLSTTHPGNAMPAEVNRDAMKVISITDSAQARKEAGDAKRLVESLSGAQCMQLSVKPADAPRAQTAFAALGLGERLTSRNVEEFTRFAVALPIQRDRKTADTLVTNLKKANVKDLLVMADNSISLGLFSSEESAKRLVSELETKSATFTKGISITAKNPLAKETIFVVREPDTLLIAKAALMQKDFNGSVLTGATCQNAPEVAAVATSAATTDAPKEPAKDATKVPVTPAASVAEKNSKK